jgi:hypothetical protein
MSIRKWVLAAIVAAGFGSGAQAATYRADLELTGAGILDANGATVLEAYDNWWGIIVGKVMKVRVFIEPTEDATQSYLEITERGRHIMSWQVERHGDAYSAFYEEHPYATWYDFSFSPAYGYLFFTDILDDDTMKYADVEIRNIAPVPLPAGAILLPAALAGFGLMRRRKKAVS